MGIKNSLIRFGSTMKYKTQKNAPTILLIAGVALDIFTLYQTVKKVGKVKEIIKDHNEKLEEIHNDEQMTEQEQKKAVRHQYISTTGKVAKEVAVPAATFIMAKGCYVASVDIMKTRYVAAVGLYESTKTAFEQYRKNNVDIYGKEADEACMHGPTYEVVNMAPENEGGAVTKETVRNTEKAVNDITSQWFDERSGLYERDHSLNHFMLSKQEEYLNEHVMKTKGWMCFYDDILVPLDLNRDMTGDEVRAARALGKVWDPNKTDEENYVSFGIDDPINTRDPRNPVFTLEFKNLDILDNVMPRGQFKTIFDRK